MIDLHIINKSSEPITIYKLKMLHFKKIINWEKYRYDHLHLRYITYSSTSYSQIEYDTSIKFDVPLRLEPYSVFKGQIFIPFLPDDIKDNYLILAILMTSKRPKLKLIKLRQHKIKIYNEDDDGTYEYK